MSESKNYIEKTIKYFNDRGDYHIADELDWIRDDLDELAKLKEENERDKKLLKELDKFALHIKSEIARACDANFNCLGCIGCTDLPDGELCRCCWHIKVEGKNYPLWDIDSTFRKLPDLYKEAPGEQG